MDKLIVFVESNVAALPTGVTACIFNSSLKVNKYTLEAKTIDSLVEQGLLAYKVEQVSLPRINHLGWQEAIAPIAELLVEELLYETKGKPDTLIRNIGCPPNFYKRIPAISVKADKHFAIPAMICSAKRKWWAANVYSKSYPMYNWDNNYGLINNDHILRVLEHGANLNTHYKSFIENLPRIWCKKILMFEPEFMTYKNLLKQPPQWWRRLRGQGPFLKHFDFASIRKYAELTCNYRCGRYWPFELRNDINQLINNEKESCS